MLLNEFASLKRLTVIKEALALMAGYGLKAYLIVQDLQQFHSAYDRDEGLVGNCHIRFAYAPNKLETAELLSRMAGQTQSCVSRSRFLGYERAAGEDSAANRFGRARCHYRYSWTAYVLAPISSGKRFTE